MKIKFQILYAILCLILVRFSDMCGISGEKCICIIDSMTLEMSCLEKSSNPMILNLNEIIINENVNNLIIKIENKIYDGINQSSYGKFLGKIKELWVYNNQINKLESNNFQMLTNLRKLNLTSNEIEDIEKNAFAGLFSLQCLFLYDNKIKTIRNETFNNLVNLRELDLHQNQIESIEENSYLGAVNLQTLNFYNN
jgi:Leucine-rich repeat (LRR) protein